MKKLSLAILVVALVVSVCSVASAAPVITNPSFEVTVYPLWPGGGTPVPGWDGSSGTNPDCLMIDNGDGTYTPDQTQPNAAGKGPFCEIGPYDLISSAMISPGMVISQEISGFEVGKTYEISYWEARRGNYWYSEGIDPMMWAMIDDEILVEKHLVDQTIAPHWEQYSGTFVATATEMTLAFHLLRSADGPCDITNNLDLVEVREVVPEPATMALMVAAGLPILLKRRQRRS